jgi:hypothetical protein
MDTTKPNSLGLTRHNQPVILRDDKAWCGFESKGLSSDGLSMHYHASVMNYFKPIGLMLFNIYPGTTVQCFISTREQLDIAFYGTLPAQIFSRARSYEHLFQLMREEDTNLNEWANFAAVEVGNIIRIVLKNDRPDVLYNAQVAMWGIAARF